MKLYLILFLSFFFSKSFGQNVSTNNLIEILVKYGNDENSEIQKDSLWNDFVNQFEFDIQNLNSNDISFNELKKYSDTTNYQFNTFLSEDKDFTLYTFGNGFDHLNYITKKLTDETNSIVLKDNRRHDYFTEIHNINKNEFLLMLRMDDMSFSSNYAYVIELKDGFAIKKDAFGDTNQEVLSVDSWTNIDNSYPAKDDATGLYEMKGGMEYLEAIKINFNPKNQTIFYSFYRLKDGKKITRKAKYKNGHFKIKSYDARTFEE